MPKTSDFQSVECFKNLQSVIECQQPTADLYKFVGRIHFTNANSGSKVTCPLGPENVILRGSKLKETQFIYGKLLKFDFLKSVHLLSFNF